jgi:hypothetical protein
VALDDSGVSRAFRAFDAGSRILASTTTIVTILLLVGFCAQYSCQAIFARKLYAATGCAVFSETRLP